MNERIRELCKRAGFIGEGFQNTVIGTCQETALENLAELIVEEMHRKVIASILITDVLMEEKGQKPTSEDYIRALNKDFGGEE